MSVNFKIKDMFCIELIRDGFCSVFLRISSVQIYGREILQVRPLRPLRQGDFYEIEGHLSLSLSCYVPLPKQRTGFSLVVSHNQ